MQKPKTFKHWHTQKPAPNYSLKSMFVSIACEEVSMPKKKNTEGYVIIIIIIYKGM